MEAIVKIIGGLALAFLGLGYLYRPAVVLRLHAVGRHFFFNDAHLLNFRRARGVIFFAFGAVLLYSGFLNLQPVSTAKPTAALREGYRAYHERRFKDAVDVATTYLTIDPSNPHADFLLRQARLAAKRAGQTR